jgi:carbamoyltransferase
MADHLCLTLGHNSSAVVIRKGKVICGYENERLSRIKSDSQFPRQAIEECIKYSEEIDNIYISHWSTDANLSSLSLKHFDPYALNNYFPNANIHTLSKEFTHHDAHYWSSLAFAGKDYEEEFSIVADGFGNFGETISIYHKGNLLERTFGYASSLGLLYQYATAYLGMKMNQDEFKLLGYESLIFSHVTKDAKKIIDDEIFKILKSINYEQRSLVPDFKFDPMYSIDSLPMLRSEYSDIFDSILKKIKEKTAMIIDFDTIRVIISYVVQTIVEKCILNIINRFKMKRVLLSGGVFLNVKLNNEISKVVDEICVNPLCGDQGAALGIYHYQMGDLEIDNLYWGKRDISVANFIHGINCLNSDNIDMLYGPLSKGMILNIITGNMEFGPRALCNTSTLALPTDGRDKYINSVNGRSNIMPMAPVMTDPSKFFNLKNIHRSLDFMVIAQDYKDSYLSTAISHTYYDTNITTGRPQKINKSHILYDIINTFGCLINTSFNIHGSPIVFDVKDINEACKYQRERDYLHRVLTVYIS